MNAARTALLAALRDAGIHTPEAFAARTGRRLCDLTRVKALEVLRATIARRSPGSRAPPVVATTAATTTD